MYKYTHVRTRFLKIFKIFNIYKTNCFLKQEKQIFSLIQDFLHKKKLIFLSLHLISGILVSKIIKNFFFQYYITQEKNCSIAINYADGKNQLVEGNELIR